MPRKKARQITRTIWVKNGRFVKANSKGAEKRRVKISKSAFSRGGKTAAKRFNYRKAKRDFLDKYGELTIGPMRLSKTGEFRWMDFQIPDTEKDTIRYAVGEAAKKFIYPVFASIGIKGYDTDGNPIGRYKDNVVWTKIIVGNSARLVDGLHTAAEHLKATYQIALVAAVFIHVSENRTESGADLLDDETGEEFETDSESETQKPRRKGKAKRGKKKPSKRGKKKPSKKSRRVAFGKANRSTVKTSGKVKVRKKVRNVVTGNRATKARKSAVAKILRKAVEKKQPIKVAKCPANKAIKKGKMRPPKNGGSNRRISNHNSGQKRKVKDAKSTKRNRKSGGKRVVKNKTFRGGK